MPTEARQRGVGELHRWERIIAAVAGVVLLVVAVAVAVAPPGRRVALAQCPDAGSGCIVEVDGDLQVFAAALAALGAVVLLIALLNIRFNQVKVGSAELSYTEATAGLAQASPADLDSAVAGASEGAGTAPGATAPPHEQHAPASVDEGRRGPGSAIDVQVRHGVGERLGVAPVAVARLTTGIREVDPALLRDYQSARKISQNSFFLTHILGPATQPGQRYSVAIRVTPHRDAVRRVESASFYLGRSWGNRVFEGRRGPDGRLGITTESYGPFLALCEVTFDDGSRILLDHYCDFDMGALLATSP